ncbi:hypothetical protein QM012_007998 [Aureobasidium pullulans]|uniref:Amidoligase enzyme n=1 Tax=Aureobasidium pullulans TaxID=5580 RepID=A0ABR0TLD5_AURPU
MTSTAKTSGKSTFGVELEFLVLVPGRYPYTAHQAVFEALSEKVTLLCPFMCEQGEHDFRLPIDDESPSYWNLHESDNNYKTWIITRDCSVKLTNDEKRLWPDDSVVSDVEIPSRILDFSNPSPCPHAQVWPCNGQPLMWDWRDEVTAIINTLKQRLNKPGFRIFTNETCGMHVHIGRDKSGFDLDTAKNLMGIFTGFERCFDTLLTVDRIAGYEDDHAALPALEMVNSITPWTASTGWKYSLPLSVRQFEHLGHDLMTAFESDDYFKWDTLVKHGACIRYWLHRLYSTTSFAELGLYSTAHQSCVNLEHLVHNDSKKPTIEIRLHPGTLEVCEILAWIDLLCALSVYAETNTTTAVLAYFESAYENPSLTLVDIARLVNASSATIDHYTNLLSADYSSQRFHRNTSTQPFDSLTALYTYNEKHRLSQTSPQAISTRITQKLISGRYGQFPLCFLNEFLPEEIKKAADNNDAKFLSDEMDKKSLEEWSDKVEAVVEKAVQKKIGRGY